MSSHDAGGNAHRPSQATERTPNEKNAQSSFEKEPIVAVALAAAKFKGKQKTYGACASGCYDNVREQLKMWGAPLKLLSEAWTGFLPIVGPLALIIVLSCHHKTIFALACEAYHLDGHFGECMYTRPAVWIFPQLGIQFGFLLVTWRMVHQRAYYVLMQHGIVVDFENGARVGYNMSVIMGVIFAHVLVHFWIILTFGTRYDDPSQPPYKVDTWKDIIEHPSLLHAPQNEPLEPKILHFVIKYIAPGVLAIMFLMSMDDFEDTLLPLNKFVEQNTQESYAMLGHMMYAPEAPIRRALTAGLDISANGSPCTMSEVAEELWQRIDEQRETCLIGGTDRMQDSENQDTGTNDIVHESIWERWAWLRSMWEVVYIDWWPVQLLLSPTFQDADSVAFKKAAGAHFAVMALTTLLQITFMARRWTHILHRIEHTHEYIGLWGLGCNATVVLVLSLCALPKMLKYSCGLIAKPVEDSTKSPC